MVVDADAEPIGTYSRRVTEANMLFMSGTKLKASTVLLHWHMGDGWISSRSDSGLYPHMGLATDGFRLEDVEFLIERLSRDVGVEATVQKSRKGFEIDISGKYQIDACVNYMVKDETSFEIARKAYPWKFDAAIQRPRPNS